MTQASEVYTTTLSLNGGTKMAQFIAGRPVDVSFDPVANMIFKGLSEHDTALMEDFTLEIVKIPIDEIDLSKSHDEIFADLRDRGLNVIHEYFAILLWHQDKNILQPGESALIFTDVIVSGMMGRYVFSLSRAGDSRRCDYSPVDSRGLIKPRYPVQWLIAAKKKI